MKEFKTHQSSMLRDGCHPQFVALPGVGGVWGKCFVQPLIYLSDERYEHTLPYIFCPNMAQLYAARPKLRHSKIKLSLNCLHMTREHSARGQLNIEKFTLA